jgi:hypothetical protein
VQSSLTCPCMILYSSFTEQLVEILVRSSLEVLAWRSCRFRIRGASMKALLGCSWKALVPRSCQILSSSSKFFYDDRVGFSSRSRHEDLGPLYNFLREALAEILVNPLRGPCTILQRSLWEDLMEIRLTSSPRGPCIKILQMHCAAACLKVLLGCS